MFAKAFKSEAYRISRMKSPYILIAVLMCVLFLINFLYMCVDLYGLMGLSKEDVEQIQEMGTSVEGYEESFMAGFQAGLDTSDNMNEAQEPIRILGEGPLYGESVADRLNPFWRSAGGMQSTVGGLVHPDAGGENDQPQQHNPGDGGPAQPLVRIPLQDHPEHDEAQDPPGGQDQVGFRSQGLDGYNVRHQELYREQNRDDQSGKAGHLEQCFMFISGDFQR